MTTKQLQQEIEQAEKRVQELKEKLNSKPTPEQKFWDIVHSINRPFLTHENWPDEIFFFRDDTYLFSYDTKNGYLWCSDYNVWRIFEEYGMENVEIQSFIKIEVENTFKLRGVTPLSR